MCGPKLSVCVVYQRSSTRQYVPQIRLEEDPLFALVPLILLTIIELGTKPKGTLNNHQLVVINLHNLESFCKHFQVGGISKFDIYVPDFFLTTYVTTYKKPRKKLQINKCVKHNLFIGYFFAFVKALASQKVLQFFPNITELHGNK